MYDTEGFRVYGTYMILFHYLSRPYKTTHFE